MPSYRLRRLSSSAFLNFRSVSSFSVLARSVLSSLSSRLRSAARWAAPSLASSIFRSSSLIWFSTSPFLLLESRLLDGPQLLAFNDMEFALDLLPRA